jgi:hypothetical protein
VLVLGFVTCHTEAKRISDMANTARNEKIPQYGSSSFTILLLKLLERNVVFV